MAYAFQVVIDAADPHSLADWWADAMGWQVEPTDEAFITSLVEQGQVGEDETTRHRGKLVWKAGAAIVHPDDGDRPDRRRVLFQVVPERKTVKNRVHLDLRIGADAIEGELERLTAAGATFLHRGQQGPYSWITIADPEGNELCLS